ncbi:MAG: hypothetical protein V3V32_03300, partial [Dehalococcoidia bacterium]
LEEAKEKAEPEANKTIAESVQRGYQIIDEAKEKAEAESSRIIAEAEQNSSQIIEEAAKKADAEPSRIISQAEQNSSQILEEAKEKAEAEASRIIAEAKQNGSQILEEARDKAEAEASRIIAEAEQKAGQFLEEAKEKAAAQTMSLVDEYEQRARKIVEEAEKIAAAPAAERPAHIIRTLQEKAALEAEAKEEGKKAAQQKRVELVVIPPINFAQLTKLRISLQQFPDLRVLATGGSLEGGATISIFMEEPIPLTDELREMGTIEEAIEEELLDSHPLGDFLKRAMPARSSKRSEIQRILIVLRRDES